MLGNVAWIIASLFIVTIFLLPFQAIYGSDTVLVSVNRFDNFLNTIDIFSGNVVSSVELKVPGKIIDGGTGLAVHPQSGDLYGILNDVENKSRILVTIDPISGISNQIGSPLSSKIAEITFDDEGILYAVSGDGDKDNPETLFTIDTSDASLDFLCKLGNGDDGETISFNPNDKLLYHGSGFASGRIFEKITSVSTNPCSTQNISLSGDSYSEQSALTFWKEESVFLMTSVTDVNLHRVSSSGLVQKISALDHHATGITFVSIIIPKSEKESALDLLTLLQDNSSIDKKTKKDIEKAIMHIEKSILDDFWVDDIRLDRKFGHKVFNEEKKGVKVLDDIIRKNDGSILKNKIIEVQDILVNADRQIVKTSISEAFMLSSEKDSQKKLAKAIDEFKQGDLLYFTGHFDKAIDKYKSAWEHSLKV